MTSPLGAQPESRSGRMGALALLLLLAACSQQPTLPTGSQLLAKCASGQQVWTTPDGQRRLMTGEPIAANAKLSDVCK